MITSSDHHDAWTALMKRPYPRMSMTPRAIARRVRRNRDREELRQYMQQLARSKQRHGVLLPFGGACKALGRGSK